MFADFYVPSALSMKGDLVAYVFLTVFNIDESSRYKLTNLTPPP